jgi:hypothetical protein
MSLSSCAAVFFTFISYAAAVFNAQLITSIQCIAAGNHMRLIAVAANAVRI